MRKIFKSLILLPLIFLTVACDKKTEEEKTPNIGETSLGTVTINMYDGLEYKYIFNEGEYLNLDKIDTSVDYSLNKFYLDSNYENEFDYKNTKLVDGQKLYATFYYNKKPTVLNEEIEGINLNSYIENLMNETKTYVPAWNQESFKGRWNYIDGVFLKACMEFYIKDGREQTLSFVKNYVDYYIDSDGNFINPGTKELSYNEKELDSVCESTILFDLYEHTNDQRYLKAIEFTYEKLMEMPKTTNNLNFCHKVSYPNQIWLDGMYMYVPFLLRYARLKNDTTIDQMVMNQYNYIVDNMYDKNKKLYYHGHDTSKTIFWADKETGNSKSFWLRSNGWFLMSLADALDYADGSIADRLSDILSESIDGILEYQDKDTKLFYQLIDKKNECFGVKASYFEALNNKSAAINGKYVSRTVPNYFETSGSAMIAYVMMKYYSKDSLNHNKGKEIFENIYKYYYTNNTLKNICITAGLGPDNKPYRDGTLAYYLAESVGENDAKGVGPFLLAYLRYHYLY